MAIAKHIKIAREDGPEAGMKFYLAQQVSKSQDAYGKITKHRTDKNRLATYCRIFATELNATPRSTTQAAQAVPSGDTAGELAAMLGNSRGTLIANLAAKLGLIQAPAEESDDEPEQVPTPELQALLDAGANEEQAVQLLTGLGVEAYTSDEDTEPEVEYPPAIQSLVDTGAITDEQAKSLVVLLPNDSATTTENTGTTRRGSTRPRTSKNALTVGQLWEALGANADMRPQDKNWNDPARNAQLWRANQEGLLTLTGTKK